MDPQKSLPISGSGVRHLAAASDALEFSAMGADPP